MDTSWGQVFIIYLLISLCVKYSKFNVREDSLFYFRVRQGLDRVENMFHRWPIFDKWTIRKLPTEPIVQLTPHKHKFIGHNMNYYQDFVFTSTTVKPMRFLVDISRRKFTFKRLIIPFFFKCQTILKCHSCLKTIHFKTSSIFLEHDQNNGMEFNVFHIGVTNYLWTNPIFFVL